MNAVYKASASCLSRGALSAAVESRTKGVEVVTAYTQRHCSSVHTQACTRDRYLCHSRVCVPRTNGRRGWRGRTAATTGTTVRGCRWPAPARPGCCVRAHRHRHMRSRSKGAPHVAQPMLCGDRYAALRRVRNARTPQQRSIHVAPSPTQLTFRRVSRAARTHVGNNGWRSTVSGLSRGRAECALGSLHRIRYLTPRDLLGQHCREI